ncbi:MAG TPA: winged helix-turn-helix domain-containing protein [Rhizomicrobium sp.]
MSTILQDNPVYRFAGFELQPDERRLTREGNPVALTPKVFDTLLLLVERAGHVVSKDELMAALWPGRFVTEANLTKHIWFLRKALGESEEGGRYIETVSKTGYRFVAPVTRIARVPVSIPVAPNSSHPVAGVDSQPDSVRDDSPGVAASVEKPRRWPRHAGVATTAVILVGAVAWLWLRAPGLREKQFAPADIAGDSVAIVEFNNLSRNPKDAWIGPATEELLGTDVSLGGRLHPVPGELVRAARIGLPAPGAGGYAPETIARLHQQLVTTYVVSGSYLAYGTGDDPPVRLDLAVQDARSGATIATLSRTGKVAELPALITIAGAELRKDLGAGQQSPDESKLAANAQPPNAEVMRHMGFALEALHRYDPARARDELLQAIAQAPDYAPAYADLAKAWSALGYKDKALAAAGRAAAHSADLPEFMRLEIAAQRYQAQFDWPRAIDSLRKLVALQRGDPEATFELIDVLLAAGKPDAAASALADLRKLGQPVSGDARVELAAARIATAHDDAKAERAHAARALQLAVARGAPGLTADAELELGVALSNDDQTRAGQMFDRALDDYRRLGNPSGEAAVRRDIGNLYLEKDPQRAGKEYQHSLALYQSIGDQNGIASVYNDLAIVLWTSGDRDGSVTAVRNALQIRRMTGDIAGQAWALAALAVELSDETASDDVIENFRQAANLDATIGAHGHRGFTLYSLSDILRLRGALTDARAMCADAQAEYAKVSDPVVHLAADFECAQISLDRGDLAGAEAGLRRARDAAVQSGEMMMVGNADLTLGQIRMGKGEWAPAASYIESAIREYGSAELTTGEAVALSLDALCDAALGKTRERDNAAARARELRSRINERQEVIQADIALAELQGETGQREQAIEQLRNIADDARKRQWQNWALEADLASARVLAAGGETTRANALRTSIAATARKLGFGWVLQRLQRT